MSADVVYCPDCGEALERNDAYDCVCGEDNLCYNCYATHEDAHKAELEIVENGDHE